MIYLGSDHAGYPLKAFLKERLSQAGCETVDCGCYDESLTDYPHIAVCVAAAVASAPGSCGILICGTGIGVSIAANKCRNLCAALCADCYSARMAKERNDTNIITLGARVTGRSLDGRLCSPICTPRFRPTCTSVVSIC